MVLFAIIWLFVGKLFGSGFRFTMATFFYLLPLLIFMELPYEQSLLKRSELFAPYEESVPFTPFNITNMTEGVKAWPFLRLIGVTKKPEL